MRTDRFSPDHVGVAKALTAPFLAALRNLASKEQGLEVDWINIADARGLAELGLASRGRQGWRISAAGQTALMGVTDRSTSMDPSGPKVVPLFASP